MSRERDAIVRRLRERGQHEAADAVEADAAEANAEPLMPGEPMELGEITDASDSSVIDWNRMPAENLGMAMTARLREAAGLPGRPM